MPLLIICQQILNLAKLKYPKRFNQVDLLVLGQLILGKKALVSVAIFLARDNLPGLVSNLTSSTKNKFDSKISGK